MDYLAQFYDIEISEEDVTDLVPRIMQAFGIETKETAEDIAKKIIAKRFNFFRFTKEFNIEVTDKELNKFLNNTTQKRINQFTILSKTKLNEKQPVVHY